MPAPRFLLGLDVEASGMGLIRNFLIQIGLALVEVETGKLVAQFQSYVRQPPGTDWEPRCVAEFWSKHPALFERARAEVQDAPPAGDVSQTLLDWVREHVKDPEHTHLVVDTPGFDLAWLDVLLGDRSHLYLFERDGKPMYQDVLDVSSWYLGLGRECDPGASSKKTSLRALGETHEPVLGVVHTHSAADDAAHTATRAAWAMKRVEKMV